MECRRYVDYEWAEKKKRMKEPIYGITEEMQKTSAQSLEPASTTEKRYYSQIECFMCADQW